MEENNDLDRLYKENGEYLAAVAREKDYINEAHRLLDVLLFSASAENRIVNLHNFLMQIALIEDFEMQNEHTNDTRALYALAIRTSDFATQESFRHDINQDLAADLRDFLDEFETFVTDIRSSKKSNFASVLEEEREGKRKPHYTAGYKFKNVPTQRYIDAMSQQQKVQPQTYQPAQQTSKNQTTRFTNEQKQEMVDLVAKEPDKFLKLAREVFCDADFVAQLRKTAVENFPNAYREHFKKPFKIFGKAEIEEETQKFAETVDRKIQRMNKEIADGGKI